MQMHSEQVEGIANEVLCECGHQVAKFGVADHASFSSTRTMVWTEELAQNVCQREFSRGNGSWELILMEEVCEAFELGNQPMTEMAAKQLREELIQVAAVAVSWVASLDREQAISRDIMSLNKDRIAQMEQTETAAGFSVGDRVEVEDAGLAMLRKFAPKGAAPNHHGEIQEVDGDTAFVLFDDTKQLAPYPLSALKKLH